MAELVCAGGAGNTDLQQRLARCMGTTSVHASDDHGIPADRLEAVAFAWWSSAARNSAPGNLPSVTGARQAAVVGGVYLS